MATFTAGTNSTTVTVPLVNDSIAEGPETFDLSFTIPSSLSGRVIPGTITKAIGTITDDTGKIINLLHFAMPVVLNTTCILGIVKMLLLLYC